MDDFALDSVDISPRSGEGRGEPMLSAPVAMAVFTIAGAESSAMPPCWPVDECRRPPATAQRLHGPCLGRLADDTVLLCSGRRLLALGNDGRLRVAARSPVGRLVDADAATDGSVIMAGEGGVARITPDRAVRVLARVDLRNEQARVAATADGGAVIAKRQSEELLRVDPAGQATPLNTPGDVRDVTALPDGALAIALQERVVRVGPDGAVATVAGGGRGFREGARATSLGLSDVSSVSAAADGALLVSARHGVLRVDSAGRITTVVRAVATSKDIELGDPRAADADGLRSDAARLSDVVAVQAAAGEQALALTPVPGQWSAYRLAMLAARPDRLAVAVPASARTLIRRGRLELVSTRRAAALVEIRRGRRLIASRRVALRRGNTRLSLRVPLDGEAHVVRVVARARDGAVASHQMALIPGRTLSEAVVRRLENLVSLLGVDAESEAWIDCRRRTAVQFECDNEWSSGGETARSRATLRLRPDGLIRFHERDAGDRDDLRLLLEPLTYDPRPG